jgi:hypothetical protein
MFVDKARAYPRMKHLKDAALGWASTLLTNIRLVWKGLPGTNALAYGRYL